MGSRNLDTFADVVRAVGQEQRALDGVTAVLALSYTDGRSDRLAPSRRPCSPRSEWTTCWPVALTACWWWAPTAGHALPGKRTAVGYGGYARWLRRTEKAVRESLGDLALFVPLSGLTVDLTRDGVRPTPAGWKWVAGTVADAMAGVAR